MKLFVFPASQGRAVIVVPPPEPRPIPGGSVGLAQPLSCIPIQLGPLDRKSVVEGKSVRSWGEGGGVAGRV